jgi:hypothetical protein
MHEHAGWLLDFKGGPWNDQTKQVDQEPEEEIEVPAEEGGPYTYLRAASVDPDTAADPIRVVYHPEPSMPSQHENQEKTMGGERVDHDMHEVRSGEADEGFDHQFRGAR